MKKLIRELSSYKGRHTELVSVYIPSGYNIAEIINQLIQEKSTAMNIKSKTTRKNVLDALEKIIQHLRLFKKTPENGLVVFCGNISQEEGKPDIRLWSFEPPEKLKTKIYWCDQVFVLEPLEEMVEEKEVYGLIVLDAREANIGLLKGKSIISLKHFESAVPSKSVKGGMCIHENSLIQLSDGRIIPIKELKDGKILTYSFTDSSLAFSDSFEIMKRKAKEAYELITVQPTLRIITTPEHKFFILTENGIEEKFVEDLKVNDRLLAIKRIEIDNNKQTLGENLSQILGYMIGDGTLDGNRIILYEKDKQLANFYSTLIKKAFSKKPKIKKRGNTYEIRIYSVRIRDFIIKNFPEILLNSRSRRIPEAIFKQPKEVLAKFIRGIFDAEGYVNSGIIGIRLTNENLIHSLQLLLLRFGILSSVSKADKFNRFTLRITNPSFVKKFYQEINFSSEKKMEKLRINLKRKSHSFVNKVPILGIIRKRLEEINLDKQYFSELSMFLVNKRNISYDVFFSNLILKLKKRIEELKTNTKNIRELRLKLKVRQIDVAQATNLSITTICELEKGRNKNKLLIEKVIDYLNKRKEELIKKTQEQLNYFLKILNSCLIQVILKEKRKIKPTGFFYDLYIPNYHSFIANGILLHNSQRRYDRIREDALHEFLKKVGETASQLFLEQKNLKGIIIGGPGPIKESFAEKDYLHYQLKKKFLGVKDVSYTGEYGLEELVERSEDLLKEAAISKERELLVNFFSELKNNGKVVYGLEDTLKALEANSVDTLLISEEFDWVRVRLKCPQCNYFLKKDLARKIASEQVCPKCKKNLALEESNNIVDILKEMAEERGIRVEFISATSKEGIQFKQIGGIGALLRYKIEK